MSNYINKFNLIQHVEGGYFGIFYTSLDKVTPVDKRYVVNINSSNGNIIEQPEINKPQVERSACSSIYFLLEKNAYSSWHRLKSDEIWHYYDGGSPIEIHVIDKDGIITTNLLGNPSITEGASFHTVVKAGVWFAAEVQEKSSFGLVGCTVSPGFEYQDFELAEQNVLINQYPNLTSIIERLIHKDTLQSEYISPQRLIISTDTRKKLTASDYKNILQLEKHIEGGYFKVCYTSEDEVIPLDDRYRANEPQINIHDNKRMSLSIEKRSAGSFIYFMLEHQDFSAWHRLKSDEIWHYYDGGSPIDIHTIDPDGALQTHTLGNPEMTDYASFQVVITAGRWFSAEVRDKLSFGLVGCTVSPGFEYKDFELANKKDLVAKFPKHSAIINRLTHAKPNHSNALTTQAIKYAVVALVAGVGLFSIFKENTFLNNCAINFRNRFGM